MSYSSEDIKHSWIPTFYHNFQTDPTHWELLLQEIAPPNLSHFHLYYIQVHDLINVLFSLLSIYATHVPTYNQLSDGSFTCGMPQPHFSC